MVLRLWSRLVYSEESIACEPGRVGLRPAILLFSILLEVLIAHIKVRWVSRGYSPEFVL
jgi:hypothetical protein